MSVSSSTSSVSYVGNNSTSTAYVVPFVFFDATDLKVFSVAAGVSTLLTLSTNYTVSGGAGATGSILTTAAIPATSTVIIVRSVPYTQLTSFTTGDRLPAASIEKALDKLTMSTQQLSRNTIPDTAATTGPAPYVLGVSDAGASPAWVSQTSSGIGVGAITSTMLASNSVTTVKVADGSITASKLDPNLNVGGATGGGTDKVFYENGQTVTTNYSISVGKNAMSAGPITVNNGITVTVPSGANWSIV